MGQTRMGLFRAPPPPTHTRPHPHTHRHTPKPTPTNPPPFWCVGDRGGLVVNYLLYKPIEFRRAGVSGYRGVWREVKRAAKAVFRARLSPCPHGGVSCRGRPKACGKPGREKPWHITREQLLAFLERMTPEQAERASRERTPVTPEEERARIR